MGEFECSKCHEIFDTKQGLQRHLDRKNPCDAGKYVCKSCGKKFQENSARYRHQKICCGKKQSTGQKDQQIQSLKNALAASGALNQEIRAKQKIIQNQITNNTNNITINDIKNVTQNIVILASGDENIDHLKRMPIEQLKEKIAFDKSPQTHIDAFKMIRLDPEHPENHNILLTERDSHKVHFYGDDKTWREGDYNFQVRNAIFDTNRNIGELIPYKERMESEYYWNHLQRGIALACNERNDAALKPIFEGIRDPLHQATLRLMNMETFKSESGSRDGSPMRRNIEAELAIEQERTRRSTEKTKQLEIETRQMEIQLELAKLRARA